MGVGHAVITAAKQSIAKDAARTKRDLAALLLVDDVLPDGLAGGPAGFVIGIDDSKDTVPLVSLADLIAEKGERRRHSHCRGRDRPQDILPAQARRKHHAAADDGIDDGGAVVALNMDDEDGHCQMQQQLAQLLRLVEPGAHIVQVHGKSQDKADLGQLRGLQGKTSQLVPGIVVGIACVVADGQRADAHIAQHQRGQHHAPGQGYVHRPHLHQAAVIDIGQQHRNDQPDEGCTRLHRRPAVIAQTGDLACDLIHGKAIALLGCPARKRCHSHHAAEDAQQQVSFIGALEVAPNVFQTKTPLSFIGSPAQVCFTRPQCRRGCILLHYVI